MAAAAVLALLAAACLLAPGSQAQPNIHLAPSTAQPEVSAPSPATQSASVTVNVTSFKNRDRVLVSWTGVQRPTSADAIAAVIAGSNLNASVPLRYFLIGQVNDSALGYLYSGSGNATFELLNQRADIQFLLFSNLTKYGNFSQEGVIGASPIVAVQNPNEPVQVHLALTWGGPSNMLVLWQTRDAGTPTVMYGTSAANLSLSTAGNSSTYTKEHMRGSPANSTGWIDPGTTNAVNLTGLDVDTTYYYKVGDPNFGYSTVYNMSTGPAVGPTSSVNVLINADPGHATRDGSYEFEYDHNTRILSAPGSSDDIYSAIVNQFNGNGLQQGAALQIAADQVADSEGVTLAFFNGDLSYARGFATQWDVHFDLNSDLSSMVPTMVVEGNHERDQPGTGDRFQGTATDSGGEAGIPTHYRYQMPTTPPLSDNYYFSYNHGPVHYLHYSTEIDYAPGSDQQSFIKADLASVNRSVTPWIIANLHRPIYTTSISGVSQSSDLQGAADQRSAFEDLFYEYSVDLTFAGHVHWYQRTCNVYQMTCIPDNADGSANAPMHITLGNGGQWLSLYFDPNMPAFVEALSVEHGYMRYSVNQTHLVGTMKSSVTGVVMDTFTLFKPAGFTNNATARAAQLGQFEPDHSLAANWIVSQGIDGGIIGNITGLLLSVLQANPSMYAGLANATLVQNINAVDTLENTIQVLQPALDLLFTPQIMESKQLSVEARAVIQEFWVPWYSYFNNGTNLNPYLLGNGIGSAASA